MFLNEHALIHIQCLLRILSLFHECGVEYKRGWKWVVMRTNMTAKFKLHKVVYIYSVQMLWGI